MNIIRLAKCLNPYQSLDVARHDLDPNSLHKLLADNNVAGRGEVFTCSEGYGQTE